jgi:hypothetical protein
MTCVTHSRQHQHHTTSTLSRNTQATLQWFQKLYPAAYNQLELSSCSSSHAMTFQGPICHTMLATAVSHAQTRPGSTHLQAAVVTGRLAHAPPADQACQQQGPLRLPPWQPHRSC